MFFFFVVFFKQKLTVLTIKAHGHRSLTSVYDSNMYASYTCATNSLTYLQHLEVLLLR